MTVTEATDTTHPCSCRCHWNPVDHVPVCPVHALPLHAADRDGWGECEQVTRGRLPTAVQGRPGPRRRCGTWPPERWDWLPRIIFNAADVPPLNGFAPPTAPAPGAGRWHLERRRCPDCRAWVPHVVGEHRLVCTRCGLAAWTAEVLR